MKIVNVSLKGNNYSILFTPDIFEYNGVKRGSRSGSGIRFSFNYNNYATWWRGFGKQYDGKGYRLGIFEWQYWPKQCYHFYIGKFAISRLNRR